MPNLRNYALYATKYVANNEKQFNLHSNLQKKSAIKPYNILRRRIFSTSQQDLSKYVCNCLHDFVT